MTIFQFPTEPKILAFLQSHPFYTDLDAGQSSKIISKTFSEKVYKYTELQNQILQLHKDRSIEFPECNVEKMLYYKSILGVLQDCALVNQYSEVKVLDEKGLIDL